jgi:hypothetical protein
VSKRSGVDERFVAASSSSIISAIGFDGRKNQLGISLSV